MEEEIGNEETNIEEHTVGMMNKMDEVIEGKCLKLLTTIKKY